MTTLEMHLAVDVGLQRIASNVYDDFLPQEIDVYLNRAFLLFIREKKEAVKAGDLEARDDIRTIIEACTKALTVQDGEDYIFEAPAPDDYRFFLGARVKLEASWVTCDEVGPVAIQEYLPTKDDAPLFDDFPVTVIGSKILIVKDTSDVTPQKVTLTYVKDHPDVHVAAPGQSEQDPLLPPHTHQQIVDIAVQLMHGDLQVKK